VIFLTRRPKASLAVLIFAVAILLPDAAHAWRRDRRKTLVESIHKASRGASAAWPGYDPLGKPLLIVVSGWPSLLLGTTSYPPGFERVPWADDTVSASTRAFPPSFSYVRNVDIDGTKAAALFVDGPLDIDDWTAYFVHERFHNAQDEGRLFSFHRDWLRYAVEDPRDVALAMLENRRLLAWVERGDSDAIRDFSALRDGRRRLFPGSMAEIHEERMEGTAEYVELAGAEAVEGSASARRKLAEKFRASFGAADLEKWRAYEVGAALCQWLEAEKEPGWREAVQSYWAPSELVRGRLSLTEEEITRRVDALTLLPEYAAAEEAARKDIAALRIKRARRLADFEALPGRHLHLAGDAAEAGHSGPWLEYPDGTSLLSAVQWSSDSAGFRIRLRDMLIRRGNRTAEFVLPPETIILLDGERAVPEPFRRRRFSALSISAPQIDLKTGPGRIYDDGKAFHLEFDPPPR